MSELIFEEARKIYSESDSMKDLMLSKFTKSELEQVSQSEFDKKFSEIIGQCTKTIFLDSNDFESKLPNNRVELKNNDDKWLFDICFTGKNKHFWVNSNSVWKILVNEFYLQDFDLQRFMKNQMKILFSLEDVLPVQC
jgi:hypothetical protein